MRCSAFLCAAADFGVRFSYTASSLFSASYDIIVLQTSRHPFARPALAGLFPAVSMLLSLCLLRDARKRGPKSRTCAFYLRRNPALKKSVSEQTEFRAVREPS